MAHAFDGRNVGEVLLTTERLSLAAREHEQTLSRLVTCLEGEPGTAVGIDDVRALCIAARDQRLQIDAMLARLVGRRDGVADGVRPTGSRVLIVDDSDDNRDVTATLLEASGFFPITAANGVEALVVAHLVQPAVVLMDVNMPILDGIQATRLLRASAATRDVRVIAHTSWPSIYDGPARDLFAAVLPKPTSPDALLASIARFASPAAP